MLIRRLLPLFLGVVLAIPGCPALAEEQIRIEVNGAPLTLSAGNQPFVEGGVAMVPLRPIAESLRATIEWDPVTSSISLKHGSREARIQPGIAAATVNGRQVSLPAPPVLREGTTFVPLRFISQSLGAAVGWDGGRRLITVLSELDPATPATFASPGLELAVRAALGRARGPLSPDELAGIQSLTAEEAGIADLGGIELLTGLRSLDLSGNQITDVAPLQALQKLEELDLAGNPVPLRFGDSVLASVEVPYPAELQYPVDSASEIIEFQTIVVRPGVYQWIIHRDGYASELLNENVTYWRKIYNLNDGDEVWSLWYFSCATGTCERAIVDVYFADGEWRSRVHGFNPPLQVRLRNPDGSHFTGLAPLAELPNLKRLRFDQILPYHFEPFRDRPDFTWEVALAETGPTPDAARARWEQLRPRFEGDPMLEPVSAQPPYQAGQVAPGLLADGLNMANFVRYLAGLPDDLALDTDLSDQAQHGAVLLSRAGVLDHVPDPPEDMPEAFYKLGVRGTWFGAIAEGHRTLADAVRHGFMRNVQDGYRYWVLNPVLKNVGFGFSPVGNFSTMYVFDYDLAPLDLDVIAWPAVGWFPTEFFRADDPWSVTFNGDKYSAEPEEVRVTLKRLSDGQEWRFPSAGGELGTYSVDSMSRSGRGGLAVSFRPALDAIRAGDRFEVTVDGVRSRETGAPLQFRFQVVFYELD